MIQGLITPYCSTFSPTSQSPSPTLRIPPPSKVNPYSALYDFPQTSKHFAIRQELLDRVLRPTPNDEKHVIHKEKKAIESSQLHPPDRTSQLPSGGPGFLSLLLHNESFRRLPARVYLLLRLRLLDLGHGEELLDFHDLSGHFGGDGVVDDGHSFPQAEGCDDSVLPLGHADRGAY